MGRWPYSERYTVEECKSVTTQYLNKHGYFNLTGVIIKSSMRWIREEKETGFMRFEISIDPGDEYIHFINHPTNQKEELDYIVELASTPCYFGGKRWWFICPLVTNGVSCQRRVGALYFVGKYAGCRHCKNLTYESSKENHRFDTLFRKLGMSPKEGKLYTKNL